jgi:Mn-dependent DtxR family transcriptional regulator
MALYESGEMYLETILVLSKRQDTVHAIDVAAYLGYSKPSVSRGISVLKKEECVTVEGNGELLLTAKGRTIAECVYERHQVIAQFLEGLGVNADVAEKDACRIDHIISTETFEVIKSKL